MFHAFESERLPFGFLRTTAYKGYRIGTKKGKEPRHIGLTTFGALAELFRRCRL